MLTAFFKNISQTGNYRMTRRHFSRRTKNVITRHQMVNNVNLRQIRVSSYIKISQRAEILILKSEEKFSEFFVWRKDFRTSDDPSLCLLLIDWESRLFERTWFACWIHSSICEICCSNDGKWKSVDDSQTLENSDESNEKNCGKIFMESFILFSTSSTQAR